MVTANARLLKAAAPGADLMAVVKADGYGHGAVPVARAALAGGATMLGVATLPEAVALRAAGIDAPIAAWLWVPTEDVRDAVAAGVDIGVSSVAQLRAIEAARHLAPGGPLTSPGQVPVHLKVDTGMGRNGLLLDELEAMLAELRVAEEAGAIRLVGLMSHLACADMPGDPTVTMQIAAFSRAAEAVRAVGLRPRWRHLANTAATLAYPQAHFDMVRCGIGLYGLSPLADRRPLAPAMTLRTTVALTKRVPPGHGVGYGMTYRTTQPTTLALIPVGYGDGIPRAASGVGPIQIAGRRHTIAGRVSMDQVVVDCGDQMVRTGDEAIVFGPGDHGEPTADDWAAACGTINYEIVTRIAPRVPRRYTGVPPGGQSADGPGHASGISGAAATPTVTEAGV